MRRRIPTQKGRRVVTPREWVPVAAAISRDANTRITQAVVTSGIAAAAERYDAALGAINTDPALTARQRQKRREGAAKAYHAAKRAAEAAARRATADLSIHVGPEATKGVGAPAYYREDRREVVVDSAVALPGVDPKGVHWSDRRWRLEHLRAVGLVEHEVGHAAHTPKHLTRMWGEVGGEAGMLGRMLEEGRMEAAHLRAGGDREALAGVASELILRDFPGVKGDPYTDAVTASLILGRDERHGGSLASSVVEPFREAYRSVHGDAWLESLDVLLAESNGTDDADVLNADGLRELHRRWREAFAGAADEAGEAPGDAESGASGDGELAEGSGEAELAGESEGVGEAELAGDAEADTLGGGGSAGEDDTDEDGGDDGTAGGGDTDGEAELPDLREMLGATGEAITSEADLAAQLLEEDERKTDAQAVSDLPHHGAGFGHLDHHGTVEVTPDTDAARLRSSLTRELRRVALPEVARVRVASELPPGRLRGRGAVLRSAQASAGLVPTARPFRQVRRSATKAPPPVIGIMLDVSGSMGGAALPVARLGWALCEAGRAIQARTALATFGDRGRLVEHHPRSITATHCGGQFENWREGFAVLDKRLHLTAPALGARLLICVTDGYLVNDEDAHSAQAVTRWLERHGVGIVWAAIGVPEWHGEDKCGITTGEVVRVPDGDLVGPLVAAIEASVLKARVEVGR